jgi:hypothetical protein
LGGGENEVLSQDILADEAAEVFLAKVGRQTTRFSVITDAGVEFIFRKRGKAMTSSGNPFLYAWNLGDNDAVVPDKDYNEKVATNWELLRRANPVLIRSIERTYRLASFLRYFKSRSPDRWADFLGQVNSIHLPSVRTPTVLAAQ